MPKNIFISPFLFGTGLVMAGMAIFADVLRLDQSLGWGRSRIALFLFGLFIALIAILYHFYADIFISTAHNIYSFFEVKLREDRNIAYLSKYWFVLPFIATVILIYVWLISSGTWTTWVSPTRYYADLARGFKNGNLYIPSKPDSALLTLPNPYDPSVRAIAGVKAPLDISYYKGKYYLYWGPVPSLILVAISPLFHGRLGDLQLVFVFACGIFIFQSLIVVMVWDVFFTNLPKWILLISILLIGLRGHAMFMLNNFISARIYEAAILGGQVFLMGGFWVALKYLRSSSASNWNLVFAGILWALTIGTRLFLVLPVGFMTFMLANQILRMKQTFFQKIVKLTALGMPLIFGVTCLGWYNWARFDSVTESGLYYQFASNNLQKHYNDLLGLKYVFQNLYNYLLNPFAVNLQFPFLSLQLGKSKAIFSFHALPAIYSSQLITGLIFAVPFTLFAFVSFGAVFSNIFKRKLVEDADDAPIFNWIIATLSGSALTAFSFLMMFFWAAMRYAEDFMPSLIMLSVIGFWQGYSLLSHKLLARKVYVAFGLLLASITIVVSTLLAISINDARFIILQLFSSL